MVEILTRNARRETALTDLRFKQPQLQLLELRRQLVGQRRQADVADLRPRSTVSHTTAIIRSKLKEYAG